MYYKHIYLILKSNTRITVVGVKYIYIQKKRKSVIYLNNLGDC